MAFSFPSAHNAFSVTPATNARWIATVGAPTSAGVKTAGRVTDHIKCRRLGKR